MKEEDAAAAAPLEPLPPMRLTGWEALLGGGWGSLGVGEVWGLDEKLAPTACLGRSVGWFVPGRVKDCAPVLAELMAKERFAGMATKKPQAGPH